uniref:Uncharacterized protein n=1 Tax=viral metagenome TaxID=1070528 RepID=A0A6M3KLR1_9ZZZZ
MIITQIRVVKIEQSGRNKHLCGIVHVENCSIDLRGNADIGQIKEIMIEKYSTIFDFPFSVLFTYAEKT